MTTDNPLSRSLLGKQVASIEHYSPELLFSVARALKREDILGSSPLPFHGVDIWNAYELSWLNPKNKPEIALAQFCFPCESPNLIESKSLKLYLHSFNETTFASQDRVQQTLIQDLSEACGMPVAVTLFKPEDVPLQLMRQLPGESLDAIDIACTKTALQTDALIASTEIVQETLCSNLLKSNCLVTGQPDWGSIQIRYHGPKLNREGLLRYLISHRYTQGFHEHCVERIFMDILQYGRPHELTVTAKYTRRGGLDINPIRSNTQLKIDTSRLIRQ